MVGKARTLSIIAIGILLAFGIIGSVSFLQQEGILPTISTSTNRSSPSTTYSSSTSNTMTLSSTPSSLASSTAGLRGTLVLLLHDPPHIPPGVTSVYVTYSDIAIHVSGGSPNLNSGWVDLNQTGTINLLSVVNFTQTIATVKVQTGNFDALRMNISSVDVTYNSLNYTASVSGNQLTVSILGSLNVADSSVTGAVIDISSTVIRHLSYNSTGSAITSFILVPSANVFVVPPTQLMQTQFQIGNKEDIHNQTWLTSDINNVESQTAFAIVSSSLSNSSLSVTVKNTGNTSILIKDVFVGTNSSLATSGESDGGEFNIGNSVLFSVLPNGTLVPFSSGGQEDGQQSITGFNLSAHTATSLTYKGQIPPAVQSSGNTETNDAVSGGASGEATATTTVSYLSTSSYPTTLDQSSTVTSSTTHTTSSSSSGSTVTTSYSQFEFRIVPGENYLVGVVSGDVTSTFSVAAS